MTLNEKTDNRLEELSGSDFEMADEQPDIVGWEVFDAAGDYIGDVDDLIFDRESLKVRYVLVDFEEDLGTEHPKSRHVLLPIGLVTLDEKEEEVILTEAIASDVFFLPTYKKGNISPAQEVQIRNVLTHSSTDESHVAAYDQQTNDFYEHPHFDDTGYEKYPAGRDGLDKGKII